MKLLTVFFGLMSLCCSQQAKDKNRESDFGNRSEKILIVYLSRTNNSKAIAEIVEGFSIKGGVERDEILFVMEGDKEKEARLEVKKWLQKINVVK